MSDNGQASKDGSALHIKRAADAMLVRDLVRRAFKGTLATRDRNSAHPYASLVAVATSAEGHPLLLISGLAEHTRNLDAEGKASLLIDGTADGPGALTGPRVTLVGNVEAEERPEARQRYLRRHPDAAQYIEFADFRLMRLNIERAHLVAGFGRIVRLESADVLLDTTSAEDVIAAEAGILQHMNEDHADAVALIAAAHVKQDSAGASQPVSVWKLLGCDPEGIDIGDGRQALRVHFSQRTTSIAQVRSQLVQLTEAARAKLNVAQET